MWHSGSRGPGEILKQVGVKSPHVAPGGYKNKEKRQRRGGEEGGKTGGLERDTTFGGDAGLSKNNEVRE